LHAKLTEKGKMDFPVNPNKEKNLSMEVAILAMTPLSSTKDIKKLRTTIKGKNVATAPMPAIIPSIIRLFSSESGSVWFRSSDIVSKSRETTPERL
jgi:hypothetical protein